MIKNLVLVALGGGIGSVARYLCQKWFAENAVHPFPWATFFVNLLGCLLIGIIYAMAERSSLLTPQTRLLLITGFCGGFTTFSAFSFQTLDLLRSGAWGRAAANVAFSVLLCIAAVAFGSYLAGDSGTQAGI